MAASTSYHGPAGSDDDDDAAVVGGHVVTVDDEEESASWTDGGIDLEMDSPRSRSHRGVPTFDSDASDSDGGNEAYEMQDRRRFTSEEERAVVSKFDRKLVVFVALLYMLSFLDRSNIGNARVAGMDADLAPPGQIGSGWYEWALSAFYLSYILFEWMALLWRVVPAHIYVSLLVLSWGLTASLQGVAVNYPMLVALRALLGIGEAGFTGVPFYLSFFYKREELAFRTAMFISAAPLATTFASSLAWVIMKVGEGGPIAPWRLLFLVEGFPSVLAGVVAWYVIPDSPSTAGYLTARERRVARLRLVSSSSSASQSGRGKKTGGRVRETLSVLMDPSAWLTSAIFFLTNMAYSSLPVFLPTILTAMGHSAQSAQALAAPPYFASFLIVLATAHASDATASRSPYLIVHALFSAGGYAILALTGPNGIVMLSPGSLVRYLAVYPATVGFFNVVVLTVAWTLNNQAEEGKRGLGFALMQAVGQCGPLVGTRLYPDGEGPYYERGMAVCAGAMGVVALLGVGLRVYLGWRNRRMDGEERMGEGGEEEGEALVGEEQRGALKKGFRYML
ncbi:major facilitator superfamily transporter [Echria macrotheca]|uniref:Major facilitator superfamily transporter n=1 Tax=Echria macrotheca TaxID=438768 RepID=A0AAJ0BJX7_9PEZI|nr:major facilitator superfamily transporter [Echria macrotheca]